MQHLDIQDKGTKSSNYGVFIDIDGVVLQGGKPFEWSQKAINSLWNNEIPFCFVTNGTYSSKILINSLKSIFNLPFTDDHIVVAPSPCKSLTEFHDKRVLACCQDDSIELITELGFKDFITLTDLVNIFPDLDYIDHKKRIELIKNPLTEEQLKAQREFRPIELILLLGEPINWECSLQVLIDLLMTNGDPRNKFKYVPSPHLPIIACNKDLTFKGLAALPRFGHGAFLECLESLYMKITNNELIYECIMGKPYLITYEFASNQIQKLSKNGERINKFYIIGDNPDVDIRGANLFKESLLPPLEMIRSSRSSRRQSQQEYGLMRSPSFTNQSTFRPVESILVCTGVYNPQNDYLYQLRSLFNQSVSLRGNDESAEKDLNNNNNDSLTLIVPDSTTSVKRQASMPNVFLNPNSIELREALSRKNSFISYFDNKLNMPDITVDNLLDAVNYIVESNKC